MLNVVGAAYAQVPNDHLKCYKVKDPLNLAAVVDLDSPQFGLEAGCKVSKAKYFCVPAEKTVISAMDKSTNLPIIPLPVIGPNAGDRICYKIKCPTSVIPDQAVTDQFGARTITKFKASFLCTPAVKGSNQRFVDNGDGTVTDNLTALVWEKKASWDDVAVNCTSAGVCPDPHDADNTYTWANATSILVAQLNTAAFAGHTDWRLPTLAELQSLIDYAAPAAPVVDVAFDNNCVVGSSCTNITNPTCSCSVWGGGVKGSYWSSTDYAPVPSFAWPVLFHNGTITAAAKTTSYWARAVRSQ
jgi:hypothetical protein